MREALQRAWLARGLTARLLLPVAALYGALLRLRRLLYRSGLLRVHELPATVVVVGNVVAGGAGKTPLVIAIVREQLAKGRRVGVISRGYGRRSGGCREVHVDSTAAESGDEPLLIKRRCGVPVFVCADRVRAARALLQAYPATELIVSDDGLQHLALARQFEIAVFDERGVGNGWLLPAGPLREPWPRPVSAVVQHGNPPAIAGHPLTRRLASEACRADGTRIALQALRGRPLKALAGIARPESFFAMLREQGLELAQCEALPDHYDFAAPRPTGEAAFTLLCTEKDAVKLWRQRPDAWAVALEVTLDPALLARIDRLWAAPLSSAHGSQTA